MAGDWIKIENVTPDKPEVFAIAERMGIDPDAVTGKLVRIWIWADQQTITGDAVSVTRASLDRLACVTGFANSMIDVGWLEETGNGLRFVNFGRHNGETAKQRALAAKRNAALRSRRNERDAAGVTSASPREEKRREEKSNTEDKEVIPGDLQSPDTDSGKPSDEPPKPPEETEPAVKRFQPPTLEQVTEYCRQRRRGVDPEKFVDFYTAKNWMIGKNKMSDWQSAVRTWEKGDGRGKNGRQLRLSGTEVDDERQRELDEAFGGPQTAS